MSMYRKLSQCLSAMLMVTTAFFWLPTSVASAGSTEPPARKTTVISSVAERFAIGGQSEVPDFQRHVTPLLGKLGCNGRACHGSFQGRGGFRLSLFGYDFQSDHDELTGRIDPEYPNNSLMLAKPLMKELHEGGKRLKEGSWEHQLLLSWIQNDAPAVEEDAATLEQLVVEPAEILFHSENESASLRAVAVWSDGTREDVTPLCRFQTNDDQVAEITSQGEVTSGTSGDTHVVVFYDNAVIPVPVIRPYQTLPPSSGQNASGSTEIDQLIAAKHEKLGIIASDLCTDAEFLRRASLDVTGVLPSPAEVRAFLEETSPDKRARKINELLERPGYVAWWTTRLCDFTGNSDDQLNNVTPVRSAASQQWYDWIRTRVEKNESYADIVEGIVLAVSREPNESYREYCENISACYHPDSDSRFSDRSMMPHYWARRNFQTSEDRVIGFAYTFLGTRIQCAQCHKHPFDRWTQDDFQQFEGFFKGTSGRTQAPAPDARKEYQQMVDSLAGTDGLKGNQLRNEFGKLLRKGEVVPFGEVFSIPARKPVKGNPRRNRGGGNAPPAEARLLGAETVDLTEYSDVRKPLMDWLRSPSNPLFAKAFVNRVWANYFHRGIVDPPDDLNLANPPVNAELLDYLADGFIASDFDMKWLHREILNSDAYQRSWEPNETNAADRKNFSRAIPRRLPAEATYDILQQASASRSGFEALVADLDDRAVALAGAGTRRGTGGDAGYALTIFGRSIRESNCDCDRSEEPSLLQTIFLRNDSQVLAMLDNKDGWLAEVARENDLPFSAGTPSPQQAARLRSLRQRYQKTLAQYRKQLAAAKQGGNAARVQRIQQQMARLNERARKEGVLPPVAEQKGDAPTGLSWGLDALIDEAYLRTLSRFPSDDERDTAIAYVNESEKPMDGLRSVLWALVNTREFIVNH